MQRLLNIALIVVAVAANSVIAQVQTWAVAPRTTDSRIDIALEDHYAFLNRNVTPRNRLLVFFPGTGAEPRNYRVFPTVAANLGFHAVGLMYPNEETVNGRCGALNTDLDCNGAIRGEVLDGIDRSTRATVSRANSIENRLVRLLQHLHRQNPQDNWVQFLERSPNGDTAPRWSSMVVAGHSQGGGFAGYIAAVRRVARSIVFCAMDYNPLVRRLANWMTAAKLTPQEEYFAMGHERDELVPYATLSTLAWAAYGLPSVESIVNVDRTSPPYQQRRFFSTNQESTALGSVITVGPRHNVPVVDVNTPVINGRYVFQPVWEYMLTAPSVATSIRADHISSPPVPPTVAPNPASGLVQLQVPEGSLSLTLSNVLGQVVRTEPCPAASSTLSPTLSSTMFLDVSALPVGMYVLTFRTPTSRIDYQLHIIR